ncbi:MAG: ATP-dependent DNA helicase [Candidatus Sericytochromatia bacterium]
MTKKKELKEENLDYFEQAKLEHEVKLKSSTKLKKKNSEILEKDNSYKNTDELLDDNLEDHDFIKVVKKLEGFEYRDSQIKIVDTIKDSIDNSDNAFIEAGTGSGKSFAYLYPVISSKKPSVISTGTIALQEQLLDKDIPFLQKSKKLPKFKAVIAKGRNNYLCLQKFYDIEKTLFSGSPLRIEVDLIIREIQKGWDGDFSTLNFQVSPQLKELIDSTTEDCIKFKCEFYNSQRAPFFNARKEMEGADLIVTNHSMYMIDISAGNTILPEHDNVIFDEAHHLYNNAVKGLTVSIGRYSITKLLQKIQKRISPIPDYISRSIINEESLLFEWVFKKKKNIYRIEIDMVPELKEIILPIVEVLGELKKWLDFLPINEELFPEENIQLKAKVHKENLLRQLVNLKKKFEFFVNEGFYLERVNWVECDEKRGKFEFNSAPLFVDEILKKEVWEKRKAVFTSATITVNSTFNYFKKQLGIDEGHELIVDSPFDYKKQAALYIPKNILDPNSKEFIQSCKDTILEVLKISKGRAFLLFSSWKNMELAYELTHKLIPFKSKKQGDLTRRNLIEWFKNTPNSVLYATSTFWEGIDIPGDTLSCVIIDKLPFSVPDDPFIQAKVDYMKAQEMNWFNDFMLPEAIIKLRQGVGRLIRTKNDKGLLVILDNRLITKFYGKIVLKSLPPVTIINSLEKASDFIN